MKTETNNLTLEEHTGGPIPNMSARTTDSAPPFLFIKRHITDDAICLLTFDRPDSSANIFDLATLHELNRHLDFVYSQDGALSGLVFLSAKKSIFIAGADIKSLAGQANPVELRTFIELGQAVFQRIADLPIPTAAAIHGACVGGGYEMALACDYRIASPDHATKIGLPEVNLGILPAWGGSTRLPRLIGLPKSLAVILAGKTFPARQALRRGMVDELAPAESLLLAARRKMAGGKPHHPRHPFVNSSAAAATLRWRSNALIHRKTRGHYLAPARALDVVTRGIVLPVRDSLRLEADALVDLAGTEVCHNLLRLFLQQEQAKKSSRTGPSITPVTHAAVIGAGVMGAGIAQWISAHHCDVILRDVNAERVNAGMTTIARLYEDGVKRQNFSATDARTGLDRIHPADIDVPLRNVGLVIEAAVEQMELKKKIFTHLEELAGPDTILASNTSALSISEIATATKIPGRVIGLHFFNPVHRMQLVEVIIGQKTEMGTLHRTLQFVRQMGKLPVVVRDSPGFLVNRILMPYLIEAGRLFELGANVEDIDKAMLEFGMPMGPLRLIDEVGIDVAYHVALTLSAGLGGRLQIPSVLEQMFQDGLLGRKSDQGFYYYHGKKPEANTGLKVFRKSETARDWTNEELSKRMVLLMVNEAARCVEETVVSDAEHVDFAMVMGTGFAPFRGGPLRYADSVGLPNILKQMRQLVDHGEPVFQPCKLLEHLAAQNLAFHNRKGELL